MPGLLLLFTAPIQVDDAGVSDSFSLILTQSIPTVTSSFTGTNGAAWGSEWTIGAQSAGSTQTIDTNRGKQVTSAAGGYTDWMASYLNFGSIQNGTIVGTLSMPSISTEHYFDIMFRATDTMSSGDGYAFTFVPASNSIEFDVSVAGNFTPIAGTPTAFTFAINTIYNWKVDFQGSTFRAKVWTGAEPGAWNITVTDTTYTAAGRVGVVTYGGAPATARTGYWDDIAVFTNSTGISTTNLVSTTDSALVVGGQIKLDLAVPTDFTVNDLSKVQSDDAVSTDLATLSLNSAVTEVVGTTDPFVITRSIVALDPVTVTDPIDLGGAVYAEVVGVTDSFVIDRSMVQVEATGPVDAWPIARSLVATDLTGPVDAWPIARSLVATDLTGPVDTWSIDHGMLPVDLAGVVDSSTLDQSTGPINFTQVPVDSAGLTDPVTFVLFSSVVDSSGSTDTPVVDRSAVATDLTGLSDSSVVFHALAQVPLDPAVPTDSFTWGWGSSPVDSAGLVDSATFVLGRGVVVTEDAGTVDQWKADRSYAFTDLTGSVDSVAFSIASAIVDSSGTSDSATGQGSTQYVQTPTDSAGATDASSLALALSTTDPAGLVDIPVVTPGHQVSGQDLLSLTEVTSLQFTDVQEDSAGVTDPVRFTWNLGPVEPVIVIEQQVWDTAHASYVDLAGVADSAVVSQGFGISATDLAEAGDPAIIGKTWAVASTDDAGVGEYFPFLSRGLGPIDPAGLVDSWIAAPGREEPAGVTDLVTLALGEVDQDSAGLSDPVTVAMGGGLYVQDNPGATDSIALDHGLGLTDLAVPTDVATALRFRDVSLVEPAGLVDVPTFSLASNFLEFPIEQDSIGLGRGIVFPPDLSSVTDMFTFDGVKVNMDPVSVTDSLSRDVGRPLVDSAGVVEQVVIALTVTYADTSQVQTSDSAVVSLNIKITALESTGVTDLGTVANHVLRLVTVTGSLAPQERILASLSAPGRLSAILGLPDPIVAQMAAQGRISVVLADPPRIVAHLEVQP